MPSTISTYIIFPSTEEFFDFFLQCVYSFHHKGLSFPLVSLFLGILFFWNYCKWNCFPIFFHSLFIFGVQKSYWFFFLLLCWGCLWLGVFGGWFLGLLDIRSCHLQIGIVWLLPFLFVFPLFLLPVLLSS
jgi:hypothetical protein